MVWNLVNGTKIMEQQVMTLWFASSWTIRKAKTNMIFRNQDAEIERIVENVNLMVWNCWLNVIIKGFGYDITNKIEKEYFIPHE
jgi:hypothetical protein